MKEFLNHINSSQNNLVAADLKSQFGEKFLSKIGISFMGEFIQSESMFFRTISPQRIKEIIFIEHSYQGDDGDCLEWAYITCQKEMDRLDPLFKSLPDEESSGVYHLDEKTESATEIRTKYHKTQDLLLDYRRRLLKTKGNHKLRAILS